MRPRRGSPLGIASGVILICEPPVLSASGCRALGLLQLYIAEANRTGERLPEGNRVCLFFDLSAMISSAFAAKKITEHVIRPPLD
jgi:hypothetical protein